jgi:hypothetical protein
MGSRAQIAIYDRTVKFNDFAEDIYVYLYSHWGGDEINQTLARALDRGRPRWNDSSYLNRIIFSEMIKDNILRETGFGIDTALHGDTSYPVPCLNCDTQTITWENTKAKLPNYTFEEFVQKFK